VVQLDQNGRTARLIDPVLKSEVGCILMSSARKGRYTVHELEMKNFKVSHLLLNGVAIFDASDYPSRQIPQLLRHVQDIEFAESMSQQLGLSVLHTYQYLHELLRTFQAFEPLQGDPRVMWNLPVTYYFNDYPDEGLYALTGATTFRGVRPEALHSRMHITHLSKPRIIPVMKLSHTWWL